MSDTQEFRLEFDSMPDPLVRGNARGGWRPRAAATRALRDATFIKMLEAGQAYWPRFQKAIVTYHAYWCQKPIDRDNLIKGCKPILDELTDQNHQYAGREIRLLYDDAPDRVDIRTEYTRVKHRKDVKLVITVTGA
jgi:hypothetical protein